MTVYRMWLLMSAAMLAAFLALADRGWPADAAGPAPSPDPVPAAAADSR